MSHESEITTSPLHQAWLACRRAHDPATANMILTQHGGDGSGVASVPKSRVDACIAALQKLAGKPKNAPAREDSATGVERLRKQAFANHLSPIAERAAPARSLNPSEIYSRWNNPPPVGDDA